MRTELRQQIDGMLEEYRAMRSRLDTMRSELEAISATARTSDGSVTATVGAQGQLVGLSLDPRLAGRLDLKALTAAVLEAAGIAAARVRERAHASALAALPDGLPHVVGPDGTLDLSGFLPGEPAGLGSLGGARR